MRGFACATINYSMDDFIDEREYQFSADCSTDFLRSVGGDFLLENGKINILMGWEQNYQTGCLGRWELNPLIKKWDAVRSKRKLKLQSKIDALETKIKRI